MTQLGRRIGHCVISFFLVMGTSLSGVAIAQDDQDTPVALVRVHLPLTGNADQVLQSRIRRTRDRLSTQASSQKSDGRPLLVLELSTHPEAEFDGEGTTFERAFAVAKFLASGEMSGVKTVAYLPRSVRGHGVLLAMACEEIVMASDALIGGAEGDQDGIAGVGKTAIAGYQEIAQLRRTVPVALAVGMIDPQVEVLQVETEAGYDFVLQSELDQFAAEREIISQTTLVPAGTLAEFDGREGRQFGFVKYQAATVKDVAEAFGVSVETLQLDDAQMTDWNPVILDVQGEITSQLAGQLESLLGTALESGSVNWVAVRIDSAGGDLEACIRLANTLASLDANMVRTVAYVPSEAVGGAAIVALACDQLVMHPEAKLKATELELTEEEQKALNLTLQESLGPRSERSWSLLAAMINPQVELLEYQNKKSGVKRIMSAEEVGELPNSLDWQRPQPVGDGKGPLEFDGEQALELDLAWRNVDSFDQLKETFNLEEDPLVLEPNWALELIQALASPEISFFLLVMGFAGIYLELRTPGVGVGGFVATVALVLFFWSQFLNGTAGWLEVLLFLLGLIFILLEVFVLPGFGIFGLGGGALVIASLVLASLTFVTPHSPSDVRELAGSIGSVVMSLVSVMVLAVLSNYLLPQIPFFRKMVLAPPPPEERAYMEKQEAVVDYSNLIGSEGVATTHLRPAGKAEIDHLLIDVIAEGETLDAGAPIVVVDARGNRVVVRGADNA